MRRIALFAVILLVPGCGNPATWGGNPFSGFGGFIADVFGPDGNPHAPALTSENLKRVAGQPVQVEPLTPQSGNIWPGPPPPEPTLSDIQRQQSQGINPQAPLPPAGPHSSVPPQAVAPPPAVQPAGPSASAPPPMAPTQQLPMGTVLQTPQGQAVVGAGASGVQTYKTPNGAVGTVVNNGNGTVTLVDPNGAVNTVPIPR